MEGVGIGGAGHDGVASGVVGGRDREIDAGAGVILAVRHVDALAVSRPGIRPTVGVVDDVPGEARLVDRFREVQDEVLRPAGTDGAGDRRGREQDGAALSIFFRPVAIPNPAS